MHPILELYPKPLWHSLSSLLFWFEILLVVSCSVHICMMAHGKRRSSCLWDHKINWSVLFSRMMNVYGLMRFFLWSLYCLSAGLCATASSRNLHLWMQLRRWSVPRFQQLEQTAVLKGDGHWSARCLSQLAARTGCCTAREIEASGALA